jgi:hypothetical protein
MPDKLPPNSKCIELVAAAEQIFASTSDRKWARRLIERAMQHAVDADDFRFAGDMVASTLKNRKLSTEYYRKGLDCAQDGSDMAFIADSVYRELNDKIWADEILLKSVTRISNATDLMLVASIIIAPRTFNDRKWGVELLKRKSEFEFDRLDEIMLESIMSEYDITDNEINLKR